MLFILLKSKIKLGQCYKEANKVKLMVHLSLKTAPNRYPTPFNRGVLTFTNYP